MDITSRHIEAAIIDQTVAGQYGAKPYAFVVVGDDEGYLRLGVAVANERGYNLIGGKDFDSRAEAREWADGLNEHIGLTKDKVAHIVISTMGGRAYEGR